MGREIRRVPPDWVHPMNDDGSDRPCYDNVYETALEEWLKKREAFQKERPMYSGQPFDGTFEEWEGNAPRPEYYRPAFTNEPTAYQIYETVSEGTPISPVFQTTEAMRMWLLAQGYSAPAADNFIKGGWAPSMLISGGRMLENIEACADMKKE